MRLKYYFLVCFYLNKAFFSQIVISVIIYDNKKTIAFQNDAMVLIFSVTPISNAGCRITY